MTEYTKTDIVFQIYDWLNAGVYFSMKDITSKFECNRVTGVRAIEYLREKRHMDINYDRFKRVYVIGPVTQIDRKTSQKMSREKNRDKIRYKKHLKYLFGPEWKSHYREEDLYEYCGSN